MKYESSVSRELQSYPMARSTLRKSRARQPAHLTISTRGRRKAERATDASGPLRLDASVSSARGPTLDFIIDDVVSDLVVNVSVEPGHLGRSSEDELRRFLGGGGRLRVTGLFRGEASVPRRAGCDDDCASSSDGCVVSSPVIVVNAEVEPPAPPGWRGPDEEERCLLRTRRPFTRRGDWRGAWRCARATAGRAARCRGVCVFTDAGAVYSLHHRLARKPAPSAQVEERPSHDECDEERRADASRNRA